MPRDAIISAHVVGVIGYVKRQSLGPFERQSCASPNVASAKICASPECRQFDKL
jgi:hypothetical protein